MSKFFFRKYGIKIQFFISASLIILTSVISFFLAEYIGYHVIALVLLLVVSILAMLLDILPVLLAAVLSALVWNYFFIPPTFTFHLGTPQDFLMYLMYFIVALINAVLTYKIRQIKKNTRDREEKENTIKLYNTLLNSLSHELRTPISAIIGALDTIKENENKITPKNRMGLLSEIGHAAFRLNGQVDNLLNMSRLEAHILKPKLDWCEINELIFTVLKDSKESASNHTIVYKINEDLPLYKIDQGFIKQVLRNIVNNAIQHTPAGTIVDITAIKYTDSLQIIIEDNGPGFPNQEIGSVFDKFYRVHKSTTGGTGLGLSIVKGFIEAHHGNIHLTNRKKGGAKFTIQIPAESLSINELKDA